MLNKNILIIFALLIITMTFASNYTLKESVRLDEKSLYFNNIVYENVEPGLEDILICDVPTEYDIKLTSSDIMEKLFESGISNITLSGTYTIVQYNYTEASQADYTSDKKSNKPLDILYDHIYSFIDKEKFKVKINVLETIPFCDVDKEYENTEWEVPLIKEGLKDITKFRKLKVRLNGKPVTVRMDIKLFSDVYISKGNQKKDDSIKEDTFIKLNMDITSISNFENIIFDIKNNFYLTKNISNGEILRFTLVDKRSDVKKGEIVTVKIERNGISLSLKGLALDNGDFGKPLSVKIVNGGNLYGILRSSDDGKIIEVN